MSAWGFNFNGQCDIPEPNSSFIAVAAGGHHNLGLKEDGSIVSWGKNEDGQCDIPEPNSGFISVAAGSYHSLGIKYVCYYELAGDLNDDCKVDFYDFAMMAQSWLIDFEFSDLKLMTGSWLIDCDENPEDPNCIPK